MTRLLLLEVCNISPQLFHSENVGVICIALVQIKCCSFRISLKPECSEGLHCLTSKNYVNKARLVTYTIS
jgi:hypothetical protein